MCVNMFIVAKQKRSGIQYLMPKKTKEQKIIASYRRKLQLLKQQNTIDHPHPAVSPAQQLVIPQRKETPVILQETAEDSMIKKYFIIDFRKSLLLIAFIIALEILLYFASMKGLLIRI